jgi:tRNA G18 (ribose-2'-O)-methylase SpoU
MKVPLSIPYTTAGSEFLYGTHVVKAALQSGRRKLYKLYIYQGVNSQGEEVEQDNSIYKLALAAGVAVSRVRGDWEKLLNKMSEQRPHNGYVLEASPVPKLPVTALEKVEGPAEAFDVQLGHQSVEELAINNTFNIHGSLATVQTVGRTQRYPFILMLDRIRDPGNLGSIIRSAYFLGVEAVVMIEHGTAPLGPVALKSSASAAEYLPLLMVKNEHAFMRQSQENGWKFFAAISPDSRSVSGSEPKALQLSMMNSALQEGPCVLLLGSEGEGIRPQLQRIVNGTVGIESARGSTQGLDSLNVGVAAALLMQEFLQSSKRAASISEQPSEKGVLEPALENVF